MFWRESYKKNIKTNHEIDDKIRDEKLQYDINREVAKTFYRWRNTTSWSKKSNRTTTFTYYTLGKAFEKQTKTIKEQWKTNRCYCKLKRRQKFSGFNQ